MDARSLEYFLAVVDHGGFGRAAQALFVAQPSLSQAIARLERETKVELFHRVGRGVVLSDAGSALVEPARQVLRDLEVARSAIDSTKGMQRGHVRLATMPSPGVEPLGTLIRAFGERWPGMVVHAAAAFEPADVIRMVREGDTELGLVGTPAPIHPPGVVMHPIEQERFVLVSSPATEFGPVPVDLERVPELRMVASPPGSVMRTIVDDAIAAGAGLHVVAEVAHRTSILPFVLQGVGSAVVPSSWSTLAAAAGLSVASLTHPGRLHIALVRRTGPLTPAAAAFVEQVRHHRDAAKTAQAEA